MRKEERTPLRVNDSSKKNTNDNKLLAPKVALIYTGYGLEGLSTVFYVVDGEAALQIIADAFGIKLHPGISYLIAGTAGVMGLLLRLTALSPNDIKPLNDDNHKSCGTNIIIKMMQGVLMATVVGMSLTDGLSVFRILEFFESEYKLPIIATTAGRVALGMTTSLFTLVNGYYYFLLQNKDVKNSINDYLPGPASASASDSGSASASVLSQVTVIPRVLFGVSKSMEELFKKDVPTASLTWITGQLTNVGYGALLGFISQRYVQLGIEKLIPDLECSDEMLAWAYRIPFMLGFSISQFTRFSERVNHFLEALNVSDEQMQSFMRNISLTEKLKIRFQAFLASSRFIPIGIFVGKTLPSSLENIMQEEWSKTIAGISAFFLTSLTMLLAYKVQVSHQRRLLAKKWSEWSGEDGLAHFKRHPKAKVAALGINVLAQLGFSLVGLKAWSDMWSGDTDYQFTLLFMSLLTIVAESNGMYFQKKLESNVIAVGEFFNKTNKKSLSDELDRMERGSGQDDSGDISIDDETRCCL